MIIKVDIREQEMFKLIKYYLEISPSYKNITIVSENLPLGDVIICDDKNVERLIVERKSIRDLSASIKDGRYEEQSYRLNGSPFSNHNIIYLIEGDLNSKFLFKDRIDKISMYSAMFSLNHYKGFSVLRTFSIDETSLVICNMAYKMKKCDTENKKPYYKNKSDTYPDSVSKPMTEKTEVVVEDTPITCEQNVTPSVDNNVTHVSESDVNETNDSNEKDYCAVIKKVKKENVTPQNIGEIMLCQIPGISSVSAIAILKEFQTLPNLLNKLNENNDCLNDVCYVNSKNQTRKINKTVIQNIKKFLLC
jgi:ERCC4-type nuclease